MESRWPMISIYAACANSLRESQARRQEVKHQRARRKARLHDIAVVFVLVTLFLAVAAAASVFVA